MRNEWLSKKEMNKMQREWRERVRVYSFLTRHIGKHEILPEFQIVEVTNIVS